jgi:chromate transporter
VFVGLDKTDVTIGALVGSNSLHGLFLLGLLAGLLTFGGAYTAIPFVQQAHAHTRAISLFLFLSLSLSLTPFLQDAVIRGQWLTAQQFLDGIAIATVLPAPLVIFSTFVGYVGGGFFGAILMTLGMFLPSFSFTLIGHNFFERLIKNPSLMSFLDGVTAGVIGLILIAAFQLMKNAVTNTLTSLLFFLSLRALYQFKHRSTGIIVVLASAIVGQVLFVE